MLLAFSNLAMLAAAQMALKEVDDVDVQEEFHIKI